MISCYWNGYLESDITLNKIPDGIDILTLSFICPDENSNICFDYLCCNYNPQIITSWINELRVCNPKIKILISIVDNISTNWSNVNLSYFANKLNNLLDSWKLDGVDIDGISSMPDSEYKFVFINLIQELNSSINLHNNKIISYTCHIGNINNDKYILNKTFKYINFINLSVYYDNIEEYDNFYYTYNKFYKSNNIFIIIKPGSDKDKYKTNLSIVEKLIKYKKNIKKGLMINSINRDCSKYTNKSSYTWYNIINNTYE